MGRFFVLPDRSLKIAYWVVLVSLEFSSVVARLNVGQAMKGTRWMPRREQAMKDVASCDKLRGAAKQASIRRFPNGATQPA